MMKTLRYFVMCALMLISGGAFAQIEFDFDANGAALFGLPGESSGESQDGDFTEAKSAVIDGTYAVTVSPSTSGTKNRIWNKAPKLRVYSGTLTVQSRGGNMKSIVFTLASTASSAKWADGNTADSGTIDASKKTTVTWSGDAPAVVFTIAGNTQISKITIYTEGGQITPGPQPSDVEEIDVATALLNISACKPGVDFPGTFRVKGYVVSEPDFQRNNEQVLYGNVNFMMADASDEIDASRKLTVFRAKNFGNVAFTEETIGTLKQGDLVVVEGTLTNYAKDNIETPEIKNCFLVSINGDTGINNVKAGNGQNGRMFNLAGQVVNNGYKGLVIMNGRKYVNR